MKKICKSCQKEFTTVRTNTTCSTVCRREHKNKLKRLLHRKARPTSVHECAWCGSRFETPYSRKLYCSPACKAEAKQEYMESYVKSQKYKEYLKRRASTAEYIASREKYEKSEKAKITLKRRRGTSVKYREYLKKRRALKRKASIGEINYSWLDYRDGFICGICGKPIDPSLLWPDPMCKTYDHIVPLAEGGEHSNRNLQLAHNTCNSRKNKYMVDGVQMYLM